MRDEAVMSIVSISIMGGVGIAVMVLLTVKSIVRTSMLTSFKAKCVAAGMNAEEIERVVLVGEGKCFARRTVANDSYPVEKTPPIVSSRAYASAR